VKDRFEEILQGVDAIVWEADPETLRFSFVSERAVDMLGYPLERWYERDFWAAHIHPDDRERALRECRDAIEAGRDHEFEYRCLAADGGILWIRDIVRVDDGVLRGLMVDVTEQREAEEELRFQAQLLDTVDAAVLATDRAGVITHWNSHAQKLCGWSREEALGSDAARLIMAPAERRRVPEVRARLESGVTVEDEYTLMRRDGSTFTSWLRAAPVMNSAGECIGFVGVAVDATERKRAQAELEQRTAQQAMVASLGQRALEGVGLSRLMDEVAFVVGETLGAELTGILEFLPEDEALLLQAGCGWRNGLVRSARLPLGTPSAPVLALERGEPVLVDDFRAEEAAPAGWLAKEHGARSAVCVPIAGRGRAFGVPGALSTRPAAFGEQCMNFLKSVANVLAEAIERRRSEEETRHRALHDPLTELPNRTLFLDRLDHALRLARRGDSSVAVFFLDLDQFKGINDTLGHQCGDQLLLAVGNRLETALRPTDTVARFGGDEFVILCEDVPDQDAAAMLAQRIASVFERPYPLAGRDHYVTASTGIAMPRSGDEAPEDLIRDADAAMYSAKERGRARFEFYDERMRPRTLLRIRTEHDLRGAVERRELKLCYQPLVDLDTGRLAGLEALLRWEHPERGLLPPGEFIQIAEASDLIDPIGRWAIDEAARQAAAWREEHGGELPLTVGVNVSARQVASPGLVDAVEEALHRHQLPGHALALELTETALIEEAESPAEVVTRLKSLGVEIVLDDFGTGYSSLSYLPRFPIDTLKLDRSFIAGLDSAHTASIVTAVVNMAQALGLGVVAEGVETEAQLYALRALGCRRGQGFLFARPMPAEEADSIFDVSWAEAVSPA
jgi:diguanylate cyclase (GGDEF)-like protein/PAS domain S-box-containing protein